MPPHEWVDQAKCEQGTPTVGEPCPCAREHGCLNVQAVDLASPWIRTRRRILSATYHFF